MPIFLRNFIFKEIKDYYEESNKKQPKQPNKTPKGPSVRPSYTVKAPK